MADIAIPCGNSLARFYYNCFTRISSLLSILFNALVLYISLRQQKTLKIYGRLMQMTAGFNVCYSGLTIVIGMKSFPQGKYFHYFTDSPFLIHTSETVQHVALLISFTLIYIHAGLPAMQFFVRYQILKANQPKTAKLYIAFVVLVLFALVYSSSYSSEFEEVSESHKTMLYGDVDGCDLSSKHLPTFSVFDKSTTSSRIHDRMAVTILLSTTTVVVYYGLLTWLNFKRHMEQATFQTRKLNRDINLVLTFQGLLPFLFVVAPTSLFLAELVPYSISPYLGLTASMGASLSPLLDALIVLFIIPAFRKRILKCLKITTSSSSSVGVNTNTVERLDVTV